MDYDWLSRPSRLGSRGPLATSPGTVQPNASASAFGALALALALFLGPAFGGQTCRSS